jgi:hypothetical protein|tara:strand:+ start:10868 stop:11026 length:159 start_codon:yes stop_codon:yes gene_type:complete
MEIIANNITEYWELYAIAILLIDKAVALSPTKYDDLMWTSLKSVILKLKKGK